MLAKDVFAASIRYLKEHMIDQIRQRDPNIEEADFLYVLTVPAIWHDGAKQFMKEAASDVGPCTTIMIESFQHTNLKIIENK